jgi:anti-anti-sigma factor
MFPQKVLMIDDEPLVLKTTSFLLKKVNIVGIGAGSGAEGLQMAAKEMPDAILLDLKMPKMSGWEVLKALKIDDVLKKIPVILFSGESIADADRVCKELSVVGILQKPLNMDRLMDIFNTISGEAPRQFGATAAPIGEAKKSQTVRKIIVERDMTGAFVSDLETRFSESIIGADGSPVVLDMKDVKRIDSRGIALCIGLKKECDTKGSALTIETNSEIHKMFKIFKLTRVIDMREVDSK